MITYVAPWFIGAQLRVASSGVTFVIIITASRHSVVIKGQGRRY